MGRRRGPVPLEVERLRQRVDQWRQTREHRTAMPAALWREATALGHRVGAYVVVRTIGINYRKLKERMAATAESAIATRRNAFVELTGAQILGSSMNGTVLELSDKAVKVVVRFGAGVEVNAAQWISAFRHRSA